MFVSSKEPISQFWAMVRTCVLDISLLAHTKTTWYSWTLPVVLAARVMATSALSAAPVGETVTALPSTRAFQA